MKQYNLRCIISLVLVHTAYSTTYFICSETASCQNRNIVCPSSEPCHIACSGNWACRNTKINCPENEECHIKCYYNEFAYDINTNYTSYLVCYNMTIFAQHSSLLIINASFGNLTEEKYIRTPKSTESRRFARAMEYSTIYCPNTDAYRSGSIRPCQILCDGDGLTRGMTIYANKGVLNIRMESTSYASPSCVSGITLTCGESYPSSCVLTARPPWGCTITCGSYLNTDNQEKIVSTTGPADNEEESVSTLVSTTGPADNKEKTVSISVSTTGIRSSSANKYSDKESIDYLYWILAELAVIICIFIIGYWIKKRMNEEADDVVNNDAAEGETEEMLSENGSISSRGEGVIKETMTNNGDIYA